MITSVLLSLIFFVRTRFRWFQFPIVDISSFLPLISLDPSFPHSSVPPRLVFVSAMEENWLPTPPPPPLKRHFVVLSLSTISNISPSGRKNTIYRFMFMYPNRVHGRSQPKGFSETRFTSHISFYFNCRKPENAKNTTGVVRSAIVHWRIRRKRRFTAVKGAPGCSSKFQYSCRSAFRWQQLLDATAAVCSTSVTSAHSAESRQEAATPESETVSTIMSFYNTSTKSPSQLSMFYR